jgi:hypothetical protein
VAERARARLARARRRLGGDARRRRRPPAPHRPARGVARDRRRRRDAGAIGFVGLVVPHALRRVGVRAATVLLPASAIAGGAFVVAVDAVARTVVAPLQLPVGVLAAAVGVPTFIAMLLAQPARGR